MPVELFCSWQIKYFNNKIICDLVEEAHTGIIALLDEACVGVGNVNDTVFLHALDSRLKKHDHYTSRQVGILCIQLQCEVSVIKAPKVCEIYHAIHIVCF